MAKITPGDGDPRHGTLNGYTNLACRCAPCTAANTRSNSTDTRTACPACDRHLYVDLDTEQPVLRHKWSGLLACTPGGPVPDLSHLLPVDRIPVASHRESAWA